MQVEVSGTDTWGTEPYKKLFETILGDLGKTSLIDVAVMVLKPEVPLFIFSVRLKSAPINKTIQDVASIREEGKDVHLSISDERYAPEILSQLWGKYGRANVVQQTRFDLDIENADCKVVGDLIVASGEDVIRDIIGALWRIMPEGIRARHSYNDGNVITVMATEEIIQPEMLEEALQVHKNTIVMEVTEDV